MRALGVEGWVRKSISLARFPGGSINLHDGYAEEVGEADVDIVTAIVDLPAPSMPGLSARIAPPVSRLSDRQQYLVRRQKAALREHIADVRVIRVFDSPPRCSECCDQGLRRRS